MLEENQQPPPYQTTVIPNCILKLSLYQQIIVVLTPQQAKFSLQETETITENHSQSKCRVLEARENRSIYNVFPTSKTQKTLQKRGQKDCKTISGSLL